MTEDRPATAKIAAALVLVQIALPRVTKTHTADVPTKSGGSYSYTYADLADVTDALLPLLNSQGIAWTCLPRQTPNGYELVGTLLHESGESIEGSLPLWGRQAQELGSSITYARRYLLGCMTGVVTEDDDDGRRAAARPSRTVAYSGPSTRELLDRVDAIAVQLDKTYEEVTAKWRRDHGGMTLDDLDAARPEQVQTLVTALENYLAKHREEQEQAAATEATPDA